MARSARNPHTASAAQLPQVVADEGDTTVGRNPFPVILIDEGDQTTRPRRSRAELQALAERVFTFADHVPTAHVSEWTVVAPNIEVARAEQALNRLTNAIEAVSAKLTSAEYLELYNAALGMYSK